VTEPHSEPLSEIAQRMLTRRRALQAGVAGALTLAWYRPVFAWPREDGGAPSLTHGTGDRIEVPEGYAWRVIKAWGDPVLPGASEIDFAAQTAETQAQQFGFNCDFVGFLPLPLGAEDPQRGLLVVNHEYSSPELMFSGYDRSFEHATAARLQTELAAHGLSVLEVSRAKDGGWVATDGEHNRRITGETPFEIRGPAAGHPLLRTNADPKGTTVLGTLANCSGNVTPWGTVLSCEENFDMYFAGELPEGSDPRIGPWNTRYRTGALQTWGPKRLARFDLTQEPHEPHRFGWIVELDPYDPSSRPKKRTALGRIMHESAGITVAEDGRVVVYSGDDARFEYLYKYVSEGTYDAEDRTKNLDLLDAGTLYVARFADDGTGEWLPLVHGEAELTAEHGFSSQADVLIAARSAADALGATPMDRPEDVEVSPVDGKVYVALTNNSKRTEADAVNPRVKNYHGQIVEIDEGEDRTSTDFRWEHLLLGGSPEEHGGRYGEGSPTWLSCPDNLAFDGKGRLWVSTDGQPKTIQKNDGLFVVETQGAEKGQVRQILSAVQGAEVTGPWLAPGDTSLFCSIQHPGEGSSVDAPSSRFPDYDEARPPRPAVICVWREDGGTVGD